MILLRAKTKKQMMQMKTKPIIDSHAHIFPDKIAQKASESIGMFYNMPMLYDGTSDMLLSQGQKAGVGYFVVSSVATSPVQVQSINNFIIKETNKNKNYIGLATMHPDFPDISGEVDRIISAGLKGMKIHSDFQMINVDSADTYRIFEVIEGRLPLLVHAGDCRHDYSSPKRIKRVIKDFPKLTIIAAHFGGWSVWDDGIKHLADTGVYIDTCSSLYEISPEKARELISIYTPERVLFGTDYPMWDATEELERFFALGLDEKTADMILYKNAVKLYGLENDYSD